jgi:hypothetical protein
MTGRFFLAIDLHAQGKSEVAKAVEPCRAVITGAAKWVRPENYHITLFYENPPMTKPSLGQNLLVPRSLSHLNAIRN